MRGDVLSLIPSKELLVQVKIVRPMRESSVVLSRMGMLCGLRRRAIGLLLGECVDPRARGTECARTFCARLSDNEGFVLEA
jgi:hypothetical protein